VIETGGETGGALLGLPSQCLFQLSSP